MALFNLKRRRQPKVVDATAEIEAQEALADDRGRPSLDGAARPMAPGAKGFLTVILLTVVLLIGLLVVRLLRADKPATNKPSALSAKIESVIPELKLKPAPKPEPKPTPPPNVEPEPEPIVPDLKRFALPGAEKQHATSLAETVEERRLKAGLQGQQVQSQSTSAKAGSTSPQREQDSGPMADRLKPLRLAAARASLLGNRDLLITQGTMIDCVQETKFVSAQAGMIECHATRAVRSTNGRVVLIDPGTRFVGYQQGVLAQGQPRIGVVWSRLETPEGVVVQLDSPGTGPLGEAGLDGEIDTHFAQRFGGAIMVSLISDLGSWATNRNNDSQSIRFDSTGSAAQQAVTTVLNNTINIPPTLYRNQAGRIGIYVARDLDFSSVYTLRPTQAAWAHSR